MAYRHEIRQASVIQGTGPGALTVLKEGLSVVIPGVDSWYRKNVGNHGPEDADGIPSMIQIQDIPPLCRIEDAHLANALGVDYFAAPPAVGVDYLNKHTEYINVAVFPAWSICYNCRSLLKVSPDAKILPNCGPCAEKEKKKRRVVQVNFIIVCEDGHMDEFPWHQWVHQSQAPGCRGSQLIMESSGSGDLKGQRVTCTDCTKTRTLDRTNEAGEDGTYLSNKLSDGGAVYECSGARPWLDDNEDCHKPVRLILRNANNLYYSQLVSSILVPTITQSEHPLDDLIDERYAFLNAELFKNANNFDEVANIAYYQIGLGFTEYSRPEIAERLRIRFGGTSTVEESEEEASPQTLKHPEWKALRTIQESSVLRVRSVDYSDHIPGVSNIHAVPTLNQTIAIAGFSRLLPQPLDLAAGKKLLRRKKAQQPNRWLPAIRYVGEGIFIELDEVRLAAWERQSKVIERVSKIDANLTKHNRSNPDEPNTPRRVLLHTLSHLLIQQLVIDGGYIAASLSERVYASENMAGILIFTASPDADGTMGGLVEQANPEVLSQVFERALEAAQWCSNDPVCMELGKDGQGMLGTNLAACHNCCLLPETSCQHFNQALDRALLLGDSTDPTSFEGFFGDLFGIASRA